MLLLEMLPLDRLVATYSLRLQKLRCSFNFLIACSTTVMSYIYRDEVEEEVEGRERERESEEKRNEKKD